jgi:hypothetical protein
LNQHPSRLSKKKETKQASIMANTATATPPTWPPPSLETNAEAIVNECEVAEMTPPLDERPMSAVRIAVGSYSV